MSFDEKYDRMMRIADEQGADRLQPQNENALLALANDDDAIIRATAVDLLGSSESETVLDRILFLAKKDPSHLVRAYCCESAIDVAETLNKTEQILRYFRDAFDKERSLFVKLSWVADLAGCFEPYRDSDLIALLDKGFFSRNRHLRNIAADALLSNDYIKERYPANRLQIILQKEQCSYIAEKLMQVAMR